MTSYFRHSGGGGDNYIVRKNINIAIAVTITLLVFVLPITICMFMGEMIVRDKYDRSFDRRIRFVRTAPEDELGADNDGVGGDEVRDDDNLDAIDRTCDTLTNALRYMYDTNY